MMWEYSLGQFGITELMEVFSLEDDSLEDKVNIARFDVSPDNDIQVYTGVGSFEQNIAFCKRMKGKSADILMRSFSLADGRRCCVVLVDGMCDKESVESSVILAARRLAERSDMNKFSSEDDLLQQFGITEFSWESSLSKGYISALTGDVLCIIENEPKVCVFGYRQISSRSIDSSPVEGSVRGPHEAFIENLRTNTALLRRRIADPNLVIEHLKVGARSHTTVAVCYIDGLTDRTLVESVIDRINAISIDAINDSGELEQLIEDNPSSVFPQLDGSELPDKIAAQVCSGQVAIMVNGSPYVLLAPTTVSGLMRVNEDDYQRWSFAGFIKLLRWIALFISVSGSAFYIAVVSYHPGLLPTDLLMISSANRAGVPFSALTEVIILEFALELLREASIRMPKGISGALSIVGGLIIGDAAITAGLISPLLVIIVGLSALSSFTIPNYSLASSFRLLKYMLIVLSAFLGLLGLMCGMVILLSMMVSTRSFGLDFTTPFAPLKAHSALSGLIELPARMRRLRPSYLEPNDKVRMGKMPEHYDS